MTILSNFLKKRQRKHIEKQIDSLEKRSKILSQNVQSNKLAAKEILNLINLHKNRAAKGIYESVLWLNRYLIDDLNQYKKYSIDVVTDSSSYNKIQKQISSLRNQLATLD